MPSDQLATTEVKKTPLPIGPKGVQLESFEALWRFAQCIAASPFAPRGMEKAEAIVPAIQLGLEIGLSPMSALQNVAVINGRPGIYGDAALALVRASGRCEYYTQSAPEGEGDARKVTVVSKRDDSPEPITSTFSVADAKKAGLWGKAGPWTQYPDRMLLFRARGFNLRDNFGDVLKGLVTLEELADSQIKPIQGRVVNGGEGIKFGPAMPEETKTFTSEVASEEATEEVPQDKPKRHRRTKAEMEAAKNNLPVPVSAEPEIRRESGAKGDGEAREDTNPPVPTETDSRGGQKPSPPRATPLEGLRNLINTSPLTEFQFEQHLIKKGEIEPTRNLTNLSDDRLLQLQSRFMTIANEIIDGQ